MILGLIGGLLLNVWNFMVCILIAFPTFTLEMFEKEIWSNFEMSRSGKKEGRLRRGVHIHFW